MMINEIITGTLRNDKHCMLLISDSFDISYDTYLNFYHLIPMILWMTLGIQFSILIKIKLVSVIFL